MPEHCSRGGRGEKKGDAFSYWGRGERGEMNGPSKLLRKSARSKEKRGGGGIPFHSFFARKGGKKSVVLPPIRKGV